jgi:hypothetical protein
MGRSRDIATILSKTEADNTSNLVLLNSTSTVSGVDSAQVQNIGLLSFSTLDSLPVNNLEAGQQAYVTGTNRLYVSNGSGWFNVALINASPTLTIDPTGAITLATDGTPTVITLTATDSDTPSGSITFSVESDGSFSGLGRISQDSSVFTITPKIEDSATTTSSTLTFKASDGVNFGSGTTALSLSFAPATVTNSSKTVALITQEQSSATPDNNYTYYTDVSSNNVSLSLSGTGDAVTTQSYSPYSKYSLFMYEQNGGTGGAGLMFDASANWYFGTSDFTIEWWQYWHEDQAGYGTMYDCNYATSSNCTIQTASGSNQYITYMNGTGSTMTESSAAETGQWYHYALVRNGSGTNNVKMYRNGAVTAQMTYTGNAGNNISIGIGRSIGQAAHHLDHSSICDFRIVNGTAVYTTTFTPPTEPLTDIANCVLLVSPKAIIKDYSGEGATLSRSYDASGNRYTWTGIGNTSTMPFTPFDNLEYDPDNTGGSFQFTRSQSGQLTGTLPNVGTGDFTIQCWIRLKELNSNSTFFTNSTTSSGPKMQWYLQSATETISLYGDGSTINSNHKPPINTWIHIALVRDTSAGNMYFYMNGERLWSNAISSNITLDFPLGGSGMQIGSYSTGEFMNGWIADMRFSDVAEYSPSNPSLFIVPESPLYGSTPTSGSGSTGNTVMHIATGKDLRVHDKSQTVPYLNMDGTGLSGEGTIAKFGGNSMKFNGVGRYILGVETRTTGYDGDLFNLYDADAFTIEAWIYVTDNTGYNTIFHTGSGTVSDPSFTQWAVQPTGELNYYRSSTKVIASNQSEISNNTWYHVALTGDSGTLRLFIDGVLKSTVSNAASHYPSAGTDIHIGDRMSGASSVTPFGGYMQDVRITKGLARYTSTFTPPTAALEG